MRYAGRFVDPALEFCAGVNFFVFQAALIPFEIVAFNVVLQFWTNKIPVAAVICTVLLAYGYGLLFLHFWGGGLNSFHSFLNVFAVKYYGGK